MIAYYEERAAAHAVRRDAATRRSILISRLRLVTFVPAIAFLLYAMARTFSPAALITALTFLGVRRLVVWHPGRGSCCCMPAHR